MTGKRAIVIGGGAAGASAAFRLQQAGVKVTVVERDDRVGGRTRSERVDGFILDVAAGLMPGTYSAVYSLMEDAGIRDALELMTSPTAIVRDGQLHYLALDNMIGSMLTTKLLGLGSKLKLAKLGLKTLSMWKLLGFDDLSKAAPHDTESIEAYGRRELGDELYEYLLNPVEKTMYTQPGSDGSVVDFFWSSKNLMSPKAYCVRGGMDRIVHQVAQQLDVRLSTEAVSVVESGDKVTVKLRGADGVEVEEHVDFCVIATPARDVPKLDHGLSEAGRSFLANLRYSKLTDLHVRLKQRPAEKAVMLMIPDSVDPDLCGILVDHNKGSDRAPAGKGSLSIYMVDSWASAHYDEADDVVAQQIIAKVECVMPGIAALVEGYHVQRWDYAATVSYPGYYKELKRFVDGLDTTRRVQLAGDYFSLASVNTAVTSGRIAATRIIERFL